MAISARLSRTIHHTLGDEAGEDLVNWMVQVEANRSELRELMESWTVRTDLRFDAANLRFAAIDLRFDAMESRFDAMDSRFDAMDSRFDAIDSRFAEQQHRMDVGFAQLETKMERRLGDLLKWSFVFWCGAIGAIAALARVL